MSNDEHLGVSILLEFLMGSTIADAACRHDLGSYARVEEILRSVLLQNGYSASASQAI
jgi:hypothetical protein